MNCQKCRKRVPERKEFLLAIGDARRRSNNQNEQYRIWWKFLDGVCVCPERNFPTDISRVLDRSHVTRKKLAEVRK